MRRIIDIHTHVFPDALAPSAIAALSESADHPAYYDGTVSGLVDLMDRDGIAASVTQPVATKPGQVRSINDWAASTASDRIIPFGAIHPDHEDPSAELERIAAMGIRGFKMHPDYQSCAPDDARMTPILSAARDLDLIAFFHAGEDIGLETLLGHPHAFARMLDAWPGLKVVLAHLGGFRCWEDVCATLVGRDLWFDTAFTLTHMPDESLVDLIRAHGSDRVLFGSDGPWTDPGQELVHLRRLGFTEEELDAILGGNAERLLGL
ncbi:MAG: amidohydrolase [Coriobacteriales bacterium]|nr:amidohydrolase [Coriobacteriales bacterium]